VEVFMAPPKVIRMGVPPVRLEILTSVSGVDFEESAAERILVPIGDLVVPVISLARSSGDEKKAAGRSRELADLDNLPR
jgi:hypothetical protein